MGSSSSKPSSAPCASQSNTMLDIYDREAASGAEKFRKCDFTSAEQLLHKLAPGDLVQKKGKWMHQLFYSHWMVHIGNGDVVHVTKVDGCNKVVRESFLSAVGGDDVRKNNHMDNEYMVQPLTTILRTARDHVDMPWDYNFFTNNCEHFAALCRYGRKVSLQSMTIYDIYNKEISLKEYYRYRVKGVYEKIDTFLSWGKRKCCSIVSGAIEFFRPGENLAIGYGH